MSFGLKSYKVVVLFARNFERKLFRFVVGSDNRLFFLGADMLVLPSDFVLPSFFVVV